MSTNRLCTIVQCAVKLCAKIFQICVILYCLPQYCLCRVCRMSLHDSKIDLISFFFQYDSRDCLEILGEFVRNHCLSMSDSLNHAQGICLIDRIVLILICCQSCADLGYLKTDQGALILNQFVLNSDVSRHTIANWWSTSVCRLQVGQHESRCTDGLVGGHSHVRYLLTSRVFVLVNVLVVCTIFPIQYVHSWKFFSLESFLSTWLHKMNSKNDNRPELAIWWMTL